ncbi:tetratricopeptide repeat protein [Streptomyces endophytica]|uniref:Tetratricopeptide repeat protein n=1 Tax=Streptomyces endophytica TaxID=2991496 RepID=A0ABY6PG53_9ACTN|nr:tetratricopeptide repeat protein [Streptomyces endophytica]UZJ32741.1 tetratricopeptide repeat protein [Streptomyces endophytica]
MTTVHPAVEKAQALIDFDRYDQALALLAQHLAENPDDTGAWIKIGYCHLNTQQPERALDAADEALKLAPGDFGGLILRARALTRIPDRAWREAEPVLHEAVRADPHHWLGYAMLADAVSRMSMVRHVRATGARELRHEEMAEVLREAAGLAREALRLGPEEVYAHEVAQQIADFSGDRTLAEQLNRAILRIDPTHAEALARQTRKAAEAPGVRAAEAADLYAGGLAAVPDSAELQRGLDRATYRMLRGVRWLALLCVGLAGAMVDLFAVDGEVQRQLPLPLGQRLWYLVPMTAIWLVGGLLRYRRRRAGVRLNVRSLIHRHGWSRVVVAQAAWAVLCALLIAEIPWTERSLPQVLFWAGLVPTFATVWFDRPRTR